MNKKTLSRLQLRLEADIASARTQLEADCLRAERAGYLARLGEFDEVQAELNALHERYDGRPNVQISAWLNLVEGLAAYFAGVGSPSSDKLKRSLALSSAAGLYRVQALSAAWLAQFDYVREDNVSMAGHVRESLRAAKSNDHSARSRVSLVIAQGLHSSGRVDLSLQWYRAAHRHAITEGDDATTVALLHNMGWLRMLTLRQAVLSGTSVSTGAEHALMGAESTSHFEKLIGDVSWPDLGPILRAQILSLTGQCQEALDLYEKHMSVADSEGTSRLQANLLADKAWCFLEVGRHRDAKECALLAERCFTVETHSDDRAAAHSRLAQVFGPMGERETEMKHARLATEFWTKRAALQAQTVGLLEALTEGGPH